MDSKRNFQTGSVTAISFAHLIHDVYGAFLAPLLPLLIDKFSITYSLAGLFTVFQRLPSLFNPLIGLAADKLPVRYFLIFAPSITAISMSLLGAAPTYFAAAILLIISGFGSALFHTPGPVMVRHVSGSRVGKGMSFFMLGGELARSLGPLLVLTAVSFWSLEETYKLIPIGLGASVILYFKFRKIKIAEDFEKRKREKASVKSTLRSHAKVFISISGIIFFINMLKASMTAFLPTYITFKGESLWLGGAALSILQLAGAAGTFSAGTISDRIGRRNTLLITAFSLPVLMWLFILLNDSFMMLILTLIGFFLFSSTPVLLAVINEVKSERPSFINGIYMTINFLISAFTVTAVGTLSDLLDFDTTYKIVSFFPLAAVPFIFTLKKK